MAVKIGIYLRISDEDGEGGESNSIEGQREIIHAYIGRTDNLSKKEFLEFCDDGYSGTNFQRPAVQELLQKIRNGEINCILVKDFSRFGRNYIEVGNYIEQVFPSFGVRFISVNENFDSSKSQGESAFISTAFQNLVHDLYSRDLSQKIISGRRTCAEQGKFVTAFAPYGYRKNRGEKLSVDEETAVIVKQIFALVMEGVSKTKIANILNVACIPSPLRLRKIRKEAYFSSAKSEMILWQASAVDRILKDRRYIGEGVYGKTKRVQIGGSLEKKVLPKDWIIVPNAHEAIVSPEVFDAVNAKRKTYQKRGRTESPPLWKEIYCGGCKRSIRGKVSKAKNGESIGIFYGCKILGISNSHGCYSGKIAEKDIVESALSILNHFCLVGEESDWATKQANQFKSEIKQIREFLVKQEKTQRYLKLRILRLYKKFRMNEIDMKSFLGKKRDIQSLIEENVKAIAEEQKRQDLLAAFVKGSKEGELNYFSSFTKKEVESFVERVIIEKDGSLNLNLSFQDVFMIGDDMK